MARDSRDAQDESACPVSPEARAVWLAAHGKSDSKQAVQPSTSNAPTSPPPGPKFASSRLGTTRVVSTIPRAPQSPNPGQAASTHAPSNAEQETGASAGGNWIYPSEEMFFNAMKRKNWEADAADMKTVVPIHNAVNERAWKEIKRWEAGTDAIK
jgi:cytochrome c heme-lyase